MTYIYYLEKEGIPFYVGKAVDVRRRKNKHYITYGRDIELVVIDEINNNDWRFWESYWISQFKTWGFNLDNRNNGGGGLDSWGDEKKKEHSNLYNKDMINKIVTKKRNKKISKTLKQNNHSKYYTDEVRKKMSLKLKGQTRNFSDKHLNNLAKANLLSKGKTVYCYNLDDVYINEFQCLREAKEWLLSIKPDISKNVDKQIKDCCNGRQKKCHGYKWRYSKI